MKSDRAPNWKKWSNMPLLSIWEGVALSLNIDPDRVNRQILSGGYDNPTFKESKAFTDRMEIAVRHGCAGKLSIQISSIDDKDAKVLQDEFWTWAKTIDWEVPDEVTSSKPDLNRWRQEDLWVESELMALCCGFNPDSSEDFFAKESVKSKLAFAKERIQRAILNKDLLYNYKHSATQLERTQNKCHLFRPSDAIAWAAPKFPDFPFSPENKSAESVNSISDTPESDSAQDVVTLSIPVVQVTLPHMTEGLKKFFQVMRDSWSNYDPSRPPKQINIAHEIDNALGWKSQKDGSASRNGQALASLIRPDELRELDKRVAKRGT